MTDLNKRWNFFWFKKETTGLMRYAAQQSEAFYLIQHFLDEPTVHSSVPDSFLNRGSWNDMFGHLESIDEEIQYNDDRRNSDNGSNDESGARGGDETHVGSNADIQFPTGRVNSRRQRGSQPLSGSTVDDKSQAKLVGTWRTHADDMNFELLDEAERRDEIFRMVLQNPDNQYLFPEMEVDKDAGTLLPQEIVLD